MGRISKQCAVNYLGAPISSSLINPQTDRRDEINPLCPGALSDASQVTDQRLVSPVVGFLHMTVQSESDGVAP